MKVTLLDPGHVIAVGILDTVAKELVILIVTVLVWVYEVVFARLEELNVVEDSVLVDVVVFGNEDELLLDEVKVELEELLVTKKLEEVEFETTDCVDDEVLGLAELELLDVV